MSSVMTARSQLETLQEAACAGDPYAPVPKRWIDELHQTVATIASGNASQWQRLDGLHGVHQRYFHHHVQQVLANLDDQVTRQRAASHDTT